MMTRVSQNKGQTKTWTFYCLTNYILTCCSCLLFQCVSKVANSLVFDHKPNQNILTNFWPAVLYSQVLAECKLCFRLHNLYTIYCCSELCSVIVQTRTRPRATIMKNTCFSHKKRGILCMHHHFKLMHSI